MSKYLQSQVSQILLFLILFGGFSQVLAQTTQPSLMLHGPAKLIVALIHKKNYLEAKVACLEYLQQNPSAPNAYYYKELLADSYLHLNSPLLSKTILEGVLKETIPDNYRASALFILALDEARLRHFPSSMNYLDEIIKKYPNSGKLEEAYTEKIIELIAQKKDSEATVLLNEFISKLPENLLKKKSEALLAKVYAKNGNIMQSYELYIRGFGFLLFFTLGMVGNLLVAGIYMGIFMAIKSFLNKKNIRDEAPKVFRPKHIFYFILWILAIPFTFNLGFAWVLIKTNYPINNIDMNQFCLLFFDLVLMLLSLVYLRKKYKLDNQSIGFVSRGFTINVLLPLAVVTGEFVVYIILYHLFAHFKIKVHSTPLEHIANTVMRSPSSPNILILFLGMVIIAPITEEIVFRGFFYNAFKKHLTVSWAVALSAVLFASGHDPQPFVFLVLMISGVLWAIIYERTKSLVPCMVCHGLHNSLVFLSMLASTHIVK